MRRRAASAVGAFVAGEAAGGIALMAASAVALALANSPLAGSYFAALHVTTGPVLADDQGAMTVHLWINDALMAVFFLLVGLEIKREFVGGRLARWDQRRLPVIAAAAGMLAPALIFLAVTRATSDLASGWAIPAATDIAFAMGVLALLGRHAPPALKLLLTTIAIVDDMGAVAIIALAYTRHVDLVALGLAAVVLAAMIGLNRRGVTRLWPYLLLAALLWLLVLRSGVHATVAGVLAAMTIPVGHGHASPLRRLEHGLNPWVAFAIVPLFGFANAGVSFAGMSPAILLAPLPLGIALGLVAGKQAGIFGSIWLATRLRLAPAPHAGWKQVYGMALLAGIGFTMSLFIGGLAFPARPELADQVKFGVLAGSIVSALAGFAVLRLANGRGAQAEGGAPDLPVMPERIGHAADPPAILVRDRPDDRGTRRRGPRERRVGIVDRQDQPRRRPAERRRREIGVVGRFVGNPEYRLAAGQLGDHPAIAVLGMDHCRCAEGLGVEGERRLAVTDRQHRRQHHSFPVSSGTILNRSPTRPTSATWKIGASSSLLIAMIVLESFMPARCWIAPEMPIAT